ncbi:2-oxoglutarate and iron-dependent oxygenase JMJD4 isoform X2 [Ischnura elegans]|nr:2-oxoglutarate and iron-dependent oxygenase JMJD4 isoform X2 [Ischnura elegans]
MMTAHSTEVLPTSHRDRDLPCGIARVTDEITYTEFFEKYMAKNIPCIFSEDTTKSWLSRKSWVKDQIPDFEYLRENFGQTIAPVANCNENYFGSQKKTDMLICDFLSYWEKFISNNYPADMPVLYLKDWHLKQNYPGSSYYEVPPYFASDWLNEFWTQRGDVCDDYRFVYMGPKGSWTPEHEDVFSSYSWSANIIGQKRWVFYPPTQGKSNGSLCHQRLTGVNAMVAEDRPVVEVIQEAGEVIFVPSGWRHEVWNLKDTISINHNWANACNIESWIWPSLCSALSAVEAELKDCLEDGMELWEEQCQLLLHATHGMDFTEFYSFLFAIGEPRLCFLLNHPNYSAIKSMFAQELEDFSCDIQASVGTEQHSKEIIELKLLSNKQEEEMQGMPFSENGRCLGKLHAIFDSWCINRVLQHLLTHPSVQKLQFFQKLMTSPTHLKFMQKLQMLIQHADTCGDLEKLQISS